jgi:hemin uptake protein HemP
LASFSVKKQAPIALVMTKDEQKGVEPMTDTKNVSGDDPAVELNLPKIISFNSLVRCGDEVWIENEGQIYRLRRTKQGKLILTK